MEADSGGEVQSLLFLLLDETWSPGGLLWALCSIDKRIVFLVFLVQILNFG